MNRSILAAMRVFNRLPCSFFVNVSTVKVFQRHLTSMHGHSAVETCRIGKLVSRIECDFVHVMFCIPYFPCQRVGGVRNMVGICLLSTAAWSISLLSPVFFGLRSGIVRFTFFSTIFLFAERHYTSDIVS